MTTTRTRTYAVEFNKYKDFIERVGWTGIQAGAGVLLDALIEGSVSWHAIYYAVAIAALKVVVAQNVSKTGDGSAIPGGVVKEK